MTTPDYSVILVAGGQRLDLVFGAGETEARFTDYAINEPRLVDRPRA